MIKISTATSVFVNYTIQDASRQILKAGYDGIDLWCGRPHLYRKDHSPEELHSLAEWLRQNGLVPISCMPAFFRYPYSLSSPSEIIRRDSIDYMKDTIDTACILSADKVLVIPAHSLHGQAALDARAWFIDSLAVVCRYAEANGIKLGIEVVYPSLSDYMSSTDDAVRAIQEIGSPNLGIVLDTGHLNLSGENIEQAFQKAGELLIQIHVSDNDGRHQQNNIPGEGCFNFPRLSRLLHQINYSGPLTVEIGWQYSFDPVPAAARALERVHAYLQMYKSG